MRLRIVRNPPLQRSEGFALSQGRRNRKRKAGGGLKCTKCLRPRKKSQFWWALGGLRNRFSVCIKCFEKRRKERRERKKA